MTDRSVRVILSGQVQGVGFRWFVQGRARALELAGWVRNRPDGTVEVGLRGPEHQVDTLVVTLRAGPPDAQVSEMTIIPALPDDEFPFPFTARK